MPYDLVVSCFCHQRQFGYVRIGFSQFLDKNMLGMVAFFHISESRFYNCTNLVEIFNSFLSDDNVIAHWVFLFIHAQR